MLQAGTCDSCYQWLFQMKSGSRIKADKIVDLPLLPHVIAITIRKAVKLKCHYKKVDLPKTEIKCRHENIKHITAFRAQPTKFDCRFTSGICMRLLN